MSLDDDEGARILAAAGRLVARRGHTFSMAELARGAGMSRATLYRRVGRREVVLDALRRRGAASPPAARERILGATLELVGERGPAAFALEDVAARAQTSVTTIYRELGGRDDVIRAALSAALPNAALRGLLGDAAAPLRSTLLAFVRAAIERLHAQPVLLRVLIGLDVESWRALRGLRERESALSAVLAGYFEAQQARGRMIAGPPELQASALMGMVLGAVLVARHYPSAGAAASSRPLPSIDARAEHVVATFLGGAAIGEAAAR